MSDTPPSRGYNDSASGRLVSPLLRLKRRFLAKAFGALPRLAERWAQSLERDLGPVPWAQPRKPLRRASLALITTGGVHLKRQPPFNMGDPNGDPSYREIPINALPEVLAITHDYYDHSHAERDPNLVLPIHRLRELVEHGCVGALAPMAYSFMGHVDGPHLKTLVTATAPQVAQKLAETPVDYALLVPA